MVEFSCLYEGKGRQFRRGVGSWGRLRKGGGQSGGGWDVGGGGDECASSPTVISGTLLDFKYDQKIVLSLKSKFLWMACQAGGSNA